jgi:hypothetical protein
MRSYIFIKTKPETSEEVVKSRRIKGYTVVIDPAKLECSLTTIVLI